MKQLIFYIFLLILINCSKKKGCTDIVSVNYDWEAESNNGTCRYGGDGGELSAIILPRYIHPIISRPAYLDSVYVKFNAIKLTELNSNAFDKIFVGNIGSDSIHLNGLKEGKYFVYVTGIDSLLNPVRRVVGSTALILTKERNGFVFLVGMMSKCCSF